ncbi:hypothetical protein ANCDUO_12759 [Ancylostoma duodenale]|uniref:Uncharacterized protein n=1 Tax=Ancylostoma duodenale TaxID=51022 RepID=A0A0C2CKM8_9BILA|nr:hypothetical protein ANCDUO_12759 [Ancylostoma duodenale]
MTSSAPRSDLTSAAFAEAEATAVIALNSCGRNQLDLLSTKASQNTIIPGEFTECPSSCTQAARDFHEGKEDDVRESRAIVVCVNANTGRVVPERLCADRKRPPAKTKPCPLLICPSRYFGNVLRNFCYLYGPFAFTLFEQRMTAQKMPPIWRGTDGHLSTKWAKRG